MTSTAIFYLLIAAFAAVLGVALGRKGAGRKRPVLGNGIALLCWAVAVIFVYWGIVALDRTL